MSVKYNVLLRQSDSLDSWCIDNNLDVYMWMDSSYISRVSEEILTVIKLKFGDEVVMAVPVKEDSKDDV